MRLSSVTLAALLTTASSFTFTSTVNRNPNPSIVATSSSSSSSRLQSSSGSDQGWNNDNFLDALGSGAGSDALNNANEQYYRESENRAAFRDQRLSAMSAMNANQSQPPSQNQPQPDAVFGGTVEGFEQEAPKFDVSKHDEENPMGGELFRSMMERAKQKQGNVGGGGVPVPPQSQLDPAAPPPPAVPVTVPAAVPPPQPGMPQPQVPQQAAPPVTANAATVTTPEQMAIQMQIYQQQVQVWQQQMNAYAQFSASDPQAAAQMQLNMPPPPTPPTFGAVPGGAGAGAGAGVPGGANVNVGQPVVPAVPAPVSVPQPVPPQQQTPPQNNYNYNNESQQHLDPKEYLPKGSGNKDAYEINNPADVYLAQLKRDSTVRTEARKRGDLQTANTPFGDVGVKAIGNILSPELIATRRKQIAHNGGEFETSRDEMIIPYAEEEDTTESSYTGVSYREKLMEMQNKKRRQQQG